MMMHVLEAGGLTVDKSSKEPEEIVLKLMRNPNGIRENYPNNQARIFVNSFKLHDVSVFPDVPRDYRVIFISRPLSAILASWEAVIAAFEGVGAPFDRSCLDRARQQNAAWRDILTTASALVLDYDHVCFDPKGACAMIAEYINTENFAFNVVEAAAVVDASLYIRRT